MFIYLIEIIIAMRGEKTAKNNNHKKILTLKRTTHCNDDLNKINEHDEPMINSSKWMLWLCKITVFKMISPAVFEGRYNTGQKFRQIWADWLCMLASISKMAGDIILKIVILHS